MSSDKGSQDETNAVRLSFRTTPSNYDKIIEIAKQRGWLNARGRPNVSAVLNFVIDKFELPKPKKNGRKRSGG